MQICPNISKAIIQRKLLKVYVNVSLLFSKTVTDILIDKRPLLLVAVASALYIMVFESLVLSVSHY